jgi:hypothetical protein
LRGHFAADSKGAGGSSVTLLSVPCTVVGVTRQVVHKRAHTCAGKAVSAGG